MYGIIQINIIVQFNVSLQQRVIFDISFAVVYAVPQSLEFLIGQFRHDCDISRKRKLGSDVTVVIVTLFIISDI